MSKDTIITFNSSSNIQLLNNQIVKLYYESNGCHFIENAINEFLEKNPNHTIQNISLGVSDYKTVCAVTYQQHII